MQLLPEQKIEETELSYWLAFHKAEGIGSRRILALLERFHNLQDAWKANHNQLKFIPGFGTETLAKLDKAKHEINPEELLFQLKNSGQKAYCLLDKEYPFLLRHINDPPPVLFVNGEIFQHEFNHAIAIVGTRRPSSYGKRIAETISTDLAERGVLIISGMATGIDVIAHTKALDAGGRTIAIMGCAANYCFPNSNKIIFDRILSENKGAIISEYFPDTSPEKFRFPARNRIISGVSQATLVVEGKRTSGSLITAKLAFEQNRQVFAIPGSLENENSDGPNYLIQTHRAQLCTSAQDILQELNWVYTGISKKELPSIVELFGREKEVFEIIKNESIHFETLCQKTGMGAGELSATLTMLELAGLINSEPGDWYCHKKN